MRKWIPPTKFCAFPSFGYWELNGKPVSSKVAKYGLRVGVVWRRSKHWEDSLDDTPRHSP